MLFSLPLLYYLVYMLVVAGILDEICGIISLILVAPCSLGWLNEILTRLLINLKNLEVGLFDIIFLLNFLT